MQAVNPSSPVSSSTNTTSTHQELARAPIAEQAQDRARAPSDTQYLDQSQPVQRPLTQNETEFLKATKNKDIEKIESLLKGQIDINSFNEDGETPLYIAVKNGDESVVRLLLQHPNIDINQTDKEGTTPLFSAIKNLHSTWSITQLFIENIPTLEDQSTFLHNNSLLKDCESIVQLLILDNKIEINKAGNRDGCTPLHLASQAGLELVIKLLLNHPNSTLTKPQNKDLPLYILLLR